MSRNPLRALALMTALAVPGLALAQDAAAAPEPAAAAPQAAAPAAVDLANNTPFGSWLVSCEALSVKRSVCRLTQELTLRDSGDLVVRFIAIPAEGGAILLAQVPIGVYLPGGAVWRPAEPEDAAQHDMIWQRCLGGVCEAAQGLTEADLATLSKAGTMLFGYRMDPNGEPLVVNVDVSQFEAGLKELRGQMDAADLVPLPAPEDQAADKAADGAAVKPDAAKKAGAKAPGAKPAN